MLMRLFFIQGINVETYPDVPKRVLAIGCELGNHSWDHPNMFELDMDSIVKQFSDTDRVLAAACGQASTVARVPYGHGNLDIYNAVGKPFFMWSLDMADWSLKNEDLNYNVVMNDSNLEDGTIVLMHDIHKASVEAALRLIPDLIAQGYKLVAVSELAEAKGVVLQNACYSDFWQGSLDRGYVVGYNTGSNNIDSSSGGVASDNVTEVFGGIK